MGGKVIVFGGDFRQVPQTTTSNSNGQQR